MKITIYQVIRNIGGQLEIETFPTQVQADQCAAMHLKDAYEKCAFDESFDAWVAEFADVNEAWTDLEEYDTLHVEQVEIELPPPAGVNAELLAALKAIRARAVGEFDCPELMAKGPLSDLVSDVAAYATDAIAAAEAGQVETPKPVRIGIVVDGGLIQEVFADGPAPQVYVIDYDVDGTADDIMDVPQGGEKTAPACINVWTPDASNAEAVETLDAIDAWNQSSTELSPLKAVLKRQAAEMDTSIGGKGGVS
jgi:hypothetical protein